MLKNALRILVNNLFKESFYGKRKKKAVNVLGSKDLGFMYLES